MHAVRNPSFMRATSTGATSTQRSSRAEASTASVRRAARRPSAKRGRPSGAAPSRIAAKTSRDEQVEAVLVALRVAGRQRRQARGAGRQRGRVAADERRVLAPADPQRLGVLLLERERLVRAVDLEPQAVLAPGRDLADDDRAERAAVGLELQDHGVLGRDRPARVARAVAARERGAVGVVHALGDRGQRARAQARDALAGDELGEVAPVRADVGEGARRAAEVGVDAPVVVLRAQQPVLQVGPVDQVHGAALRRRRCGRAPRAPSGSSGRRRARRRRGPPAASARRAAASARRSPAASRTRRACRRPAPPRASSAWRWFGVQTCTTSTDVVGERARPRRRRRARRPAAAPRRRRARASRRARRRRCRPRRERRGRGRRR